MKKVLAVVLFVLLMFSFLGCSRFASGGIYSVEYNGTLKSLANKDYSDLKDFVLDGSIENYSKDKHTITCKDCRLVRGEGANGSADIFAGVFYEEGLVEVDKNAEYYDRFRDDYVFAIEFYRGETYWFVSYNDAWDWIRENY